MKKIIFALCLILFAATTWGQNDTVTLNGCRYKVISDSLRTAELVSTTRNTFDTLIIPDSVQINSIYYKVTSLGETSLLGIIFDSLQLPNTLNTIKENALANANIRCGYLQLPNSLEVIKCAAMSFCHKVKHITIPANVLSIDKTAFSAMDSLKNISVNPSNAYYTDINGILYTKDTSKILCYPAGNSIVDTFRIPSPIKQVEMAAFQAAKISNLIFPDGIQKIDKAACWDNPYLSSVNIPSSVIHIGGGAFSRCQNLANIVLDSDNRNYVLENGMIYTASHDTLVCGIATLMPDTLVINSNTTIIDELAFENCNKIKHLKLPNSLKSISERAFLSNSNLTTIEFNNNLKHIGDYAFASTALSSIVFPDSLENIGNSSFSWCGSLRHVTFSTGLKNIGASAFEECSRARFYNWENTQLESIGNNAFWECALSRTIKFPPTLKSIGNECFSSVNYGLYDDLHYIEFTGDIDTLGKFAFFADLYEMTFTNRTPPAINDSTFYYSVPSTFVIPCGALANYQNAQYWQDFRRYVEDCDSNSITTPRQEPQPILAYPNPAKDNVTLDFLGQRFETLQLINGMGATVKTVRLPEQGTFTLPVKDLPAGMYTCRLSGKDGETVCKIVVE